MIFTSKYTRLTVVLKPAMHLHDQSGKRYFQAGIKANFKDGLFKTSDKEVIDALLDHKDLGVMFHAETVKADKKKVEVAKKKDTKLAEKTAAKNTNKEVPKVK